MMAAWRVSEGRRSGRGPRCALAEQANAQWRFVQRRQSTCLGRVGERVPDWLPLLTPVRVIVSEHPRGVADEYPPQYSKLALGGRASPAQPSPAAGDRVPLLTLGRRSPLNSKALRSGALGSKAEPSDGAFLAMIRAARRTVRCSLQDVGPMCFPGTKVPFPGTMWPKPLLAALAEAIERGVHVQMVLSNPGSAPGGLSEAAGRAPTSPPRSSRPSGGDPRPPMRGR